MKPLFAGAVLLGLIAGCMPASPIVVLEPEPTVTPATIGRALRISVSASDERPDQIVGARRDLTGAGSEPLRTKSRISTNEDIATVLVNQAVSGLQKKGFDPVPASEQTANRNIRVELRQLESTNGTFRATLRAVAMRGDARLERTYRAERQGKKATLNDVLSDVLSQLLNDDALLAHLAG